MTEAMAAVVAEAEVITAGVAETEVAEATAVERNEVMTAVIQCSTKRTFTEHS